jgi:hypothetical protein
MKNWNIIYKAELSNETTFLVFKERGTNRLKYRLINTKYKTPVDLGLIDFKHLPDSYDEVGTTNSEEFDAYLKASPVYGTRAGITIVKSIRFTSK